MSKTKRWMEEQGYFDRETEWIDDLYRDEINHVEYVKEAGEI